MTTIAYKDGIVAYDSRMVSDDLVIDDDFIKMFVKDNTTVFYCGAVGDIEDFIKCVLDCVEPERDLDCEALGVFDGKLYAVDIFDGRVRKLPLRLDNHYAIGSGRRLALAYMDTGMSAEEAVIATCKRDIYTGGSIRTCPIPGLTHV